MTLKQWLLLCVPAFFWGSAFVLMEIALPTFSPLAIVSGRMVVASVLLNTVIFSQGQRWPRDRWVWLECAGLSLVSNLLPFGLVVWGQQYIDASLAAILIAASPVFTVAIASVFGLERMTLTRGIGVLMGFAGVVVLIGPQVLQGFSLKGAGELAMLAAALSYSVAGFWGRRFQRVKAELVSTMTITMGTLLVVPLALVVERPLAQLGSGGSAVWGAGLAVVGLGVFSTAIAYIVYFRLLAEMGVVNTSLVSFLVPLSAVLMSAIFLQERLSLPAIVGMSLILGGLAVLNGRLLKQIHR
ncbi:MAG: DMT family transporter [Cyanobacteria bacterium J06623_4]